MCPGTHSGRGKTRQVGGLTWRPMHPGPGTCCLPYTDRVAYDAGDMIAGFITPEALLGLVRNTGPWLGNSH